MLGIFLKSELCQKCSKFCMQFYLGVLNNVLYVFLLKFASFSKYVCKKTCIYASISLSIIARIKLAKMKYVMSTVHKDN